MINLDENPGHDFEDVSGATLGCFYDCYNELGPGHSEKVCSNALEVALGLAGLRFAREVRFPVFYRGVEVGIYKADLVIENQLLVELKCAESIAKDHIRQVMYYLKASKLHVGLLLNFGPTPTIKRVVF
jgi:GxxExxY protein